MSGETAESRRARLLRASQAVAAGLPAAILHRLPAAGESPPAAGAPQPGDLLLLPEAASLAVEWLVVELDAHDPQRVFAVPADTNPLLGDGDVALSGADPAVGALAVRCHHGLWLAARHLAPALRVGRLSREDLDRVVRRCATRPAGVDVAQDATWADQPDSGYDDWLLQTIAPARAAAAAAAPAIAARAGSSGGDAEPSIAAAAGAAAPRGGTPRGGQPAQSGQHGELRRALRRLRWLTLAASLLLLLAIGLGFALARQTLLRDDRTAVSHRGGSTASIASTAIVPPAAIAAPTARGDAQLADVVPNLPFVALQSEVLRGRTEALRFPPAADTLVLVALEPPPAAAAFPEYRLEIRDLRHRRAVWSGAGLHLDTVSGLVTVGVRRRLLPDGLYQLRLDGLRADGAAQPSARYEIEVATASPPP